MRYSKKGFNRIYKDVPIPEDEIEFLKELAIKYDVKDDNGKYSYELVYDMVLFHNDYVFKYLSTPNVIEKLYTPYATFRPRIRYIRAKALNRNKVSDFDRLLDYVNWHNSILDITRKQNIHIDFSQYIECPSNSDIMNLDVIKEKKVYEKKPAITYANFMYKAVSIKSGNHAGKKGIIIKVYEKGKCLVKVIDEVEPIFTSIGNLNLITNLESNIMY